jgi:hypothetical protein
MTSSADLARVLRAADEHRHDPAALHRALHLSLLAIDELLGPDDVGEVVRAVEQALAACSRCGPGLRQVPRDKVG